MNKFFKILSLTLLAAFASIPLAAQEQEEEDGIVEVFQEDASSSSKSYLVDDAALLSSSQAAALQEELKSVSESYGCDVVIVTKSDISSANITAFADDYFDSNGYGQGSEADGILFLISMQERQWAVSTSGSKAITIFSDYRQNRITEKMLPYLKEGNYYAAFNSFAKDSAYYLSKGLPSDETLSLEEAGENTGKKGILDPVWAFISGLIGLVSSWIGSVFKRSKYRTVAEKISADGYESLSRAKSRSGDYFVRTRTDRTLMAQTQEKSSYSGGFSHSSTHTSSSGHTHGGSHGSF